MAFTVPQDIPPPGTNAEEVRRALAMLIDPDSCHEIRGLPSTRSFIVHGNKLEEGVRAIAEMSGDRGIYVTLNPVRPDLKTHARIKDILCRKLFLIDCDRHKTEEDKDLSATEEEKQASREVMEAVLADLTARGWPRPIVLDSGNGWHLLYSINLPCEKIVQQTLARCLKALNARHGNDRAGIDKAVHNASRITKVPGTWVRKGPNLPDRPHRMARLVSVPTAFSPVSLEQLQELAGMATGPAPDNHAAPAAPPWLVPETTGANLEAYVRKAVEGECGAVATAPVGERNDRLNLAAFNLGQLIHLGQIGRSDIESQLAHAARRAGLGEYEAAATIRSGIEAGMEEPRKVEGKAGGTKATTAAKPELAPDARITIRASEIRPKAVKWLWRDRIPVGFITLFAGRTGLGKSFVTCDLAARITQGEDFPDGPSGLRGECRNVLFISEDPYEYVLAPRLLELGADLSRVSFLTWEAMAHYTLDDTKFLERAWHEAGDPALICIDPPTNFLGDAVDEHKNAAVRSVLMHLVGWVAGKDLACVLITHVNKQTGKGVDALSRIIGSVAWATTARIAHLFAPDPDEKDRCLFCPDKNNLGCKAQTLAYRIKKTDTLAVVEWDGVVDLTSDEAMAGEKAKPRRVVASQWLIERFREKREWPSDDLFRAAAAENLSRDAVFEGKRVLNLPKARKETMPNGDTCWVWWVPPNWEHLEDANP